MVNRIVSLAGHPKAVRAGINFRVKQAGALHRQSEIRNAWTFSSEEFDSYQLERFHLAYVTARRSVPYYRENPDSYPPLKPGAGLREALDTLPILSKATVKGRMTEFYREPLPRFTSFHGTSGTTGTPLRIAATVWERAYSQANLQEWYRRIAGTPRPRALYLSGFLTPSADAPHLVWRDRLSGSAYLSIYGLHLRNRPEIQAFLADLRPQLIYGYASALHEFAAMLGDAEWPGREERFAVSTSEVLPSDWRRDIELAVCNKVYDLYASQELQHMVLECARGSLHVNPLIGVVEIVDEDGAPSPVGEAGRVVVSGLARDTMPLIRYEIGDRAVSTGFATNCSCGLRWPTIGRVEGRSEDLVITRDGRRIGYLCFHATKLVAGIREAQLVQTGLDQIVFNIIPSEYEPFDRPTVELSIATEIRRRMQQDIAIEFRYPAAIPRGGNGKFKAVLVDLDPAVIAAVDSGSGSPE